MTMRHLLWHLGVAGAAIVVLAGAGVPLASALPIGLMAGCVAMAFGMGHNPHGQPSSEDTRAGPRARRPAGPAA